MPSAILCYLVASMYSPKEIVDNISSTIVVFLLKKVKDWINFYLIISNY